LDVGDIEDVAAVEVDDDESVVSDLLLDLCVGKVDLVLEIDLVVHGGELAPVVALVDSA
jgi:hypothetical protein